MRGIEQWLRAALRCEDGVHHPSDALFDEQQPDRTEMIAGIEEGLLSVLLEGGQDNVAYEPGLMARQAP